MAEQLWSPHRSLHHCVAVLTGSCCRRFVVCIGALGQRLHQESRCWKFELGVVVKYNVNDGGIRTCATAAPLAQLLSFKGIRYLMGLASPGREQVF